MEKLKLAVQNRSVLGKQQNTLRKTGVVPGNLYGFKKESIAVQVEKIPFEKIFAHVGVNTVFELTVGDQSPRAVLVREVQRDPISGAPIHVDFFEVQDGRKLKAKIRVRFEGVAPAVKEKGGVIVPGLETVSLVCAPEELPAEIIIDLKQLDDLGKSVRVRDLIFPASVRVLSNPHDTLVSVVRSRGARKAISAGVDVDAAPEVTAPAAAPKKK